MYYILYLSSLCHRRRWPDPLYENIPIYGNNNKGYSCSVRVNHRVYKAGTVHETEDLAREAAAMHAYFTVRGLSHSEQQQHQQQHQHQHQQPYAIMQSMPTTGGGWAARRNS